MSWTNRWDVYGGNEDESINPFDRRSDTENNYDEESLSQAIDVDIFHRYEPFNGKEKLGKSHFQHKGYSDESCLEKITSDRYKAAGSCKDIRERNREEAQKRLARRLKK